MGITTVKLSDEWVKSTLSGEAGGCVECRTPDNGGTVQVRDSKNPKGPALSFTAEAWRTFRDAVRNGEFDI